MLFSVVLGIGSSELVFGVGVEEMVVEDSEIEMDWDVERLLSGVVAGVVVVWVVELVETAWYFDSDSVEEVNFEVVTVVEDLVKVVVGISSSLLRV